MILLIIIIIIIIFFCFIRKTLLRPRTDTIIAYTGGLGSGKSLLSVRQIFKCKRLLKNRILVHNIKQFLCFWRKNKDYWPLKVNVYSNIPIRLSKKEWSLELKPGHLLLSERIEPRSVVFIDEIDIFASQFDFKSPNIIDNFNEFIRLYRHYTLGGYLIVNTQSSDNVNLWIRRRLNNITNLFGCRIYLGFIGVVKARTINLSEDIKTILADSMEGEYNTIFFIRNPFIKRYDTYVYSGRYDSVVTSNDKKWYRYKTNRTLACPRDKVISTTQSDDIEG